MNTFRHIVALSLVAVVPSAFVYWCLLHLLLPWWRRLGPRVSMVLLWLAFFGVVCAVFLARGVLLSLDYGFNPLCTSAGVVLLAAAAVFRLQIERFFPWRAQIGLPEVDPTGHPQPLVIDGPYANARNPRYMQIFLALLGWAFLANYAAGYFFALLWLPLAAIIVVFEERELGRRFGPEYGNYRERVARFWPHASTANRRVQA